MTKTLTGKMFIHTAKCIFNSFVGALVVILIVIIFAYTVDGATEIFINKYQSFEANIRANERSKLKAEIAADNCKGIKLAEVIMKLQPKLDKEMANRIAESIQTEAKNNNIDEALIAGIIMVESKFDPFAESSKEAYGLMQIRYSAWKETPELIDTGVNARGALFWIDKNISSGTKILKKYYNEADCDISKALYRYNTGRLSMPYNDPYRSDYVNKVIHYAYIIRSLIDGSIMHANLN